MKKRTTILAVVTLLAVAGATVGATASAQNTNIGGKAATLTEIKMGVFPAADFTPLFVGLKLGIFKRHGLSVKIQYIFTGSGLMAAITSGQLDVATNSVPAGVTAIANGLPIKLIAQSSVTPTKGYLEVLVRGDSPIRNFGGLAGKTVATINLQGQFHLLVNNAVEKAGGSASSVRAIPMSPADEPAALQAGRLDAIVMQDPTLTLAKQQYPTFRSLGNPAAVLGFTLPSGGLYSSNETLAKKPAVIKRFVTAYKEAVRVSARNPNIARQTVPKFTGMTQETAKLVTLPVFNSAITPGSIGPMLQLMKKYGWIQNIPSFRTIAWTGK